MKLVYMIWLILEAFFVTSLELPHFYHKTEEIQRYISSLSCPALKLKSSDTIHSYYISASTPHALKVFLLFGEHPRELISTELGLEFIKEACNGSLSSVLSVAEVMIVLNANPKARKKVENGDFCIRTNDNGVDINRNWGSHWESINCNTHPDTCPGNKAFSEAETLAIKKLLEDFDPDLFISIHSGKKALFMPYAYKKSSGNRYHEKMLDVLNQVNTKHCHCAVGPAAEILDYVCPGNCMDYAYDRTKVPFSFAFEIYEQTSAFKSFLQKPYSCFIQTTQHMSNSECFYFFNPKSEDDYKYTLDTWMGILKDTILLVADEI
ncbi:unnamed protein product [Blepharisma stoltei]|uniref:Peptidase M14 domain-containing protein n=1 Tax=Blepharisma stoltei TaxID=1481888 RepID=A0AAU9IYF7_9CILI|nr:unnamed protein product [Blepharisma stoltei]